MVCGAICVRKGTWGLVGEGLVVLMVPGVGTLWGCRWLKAAKECTCDDARGGGGVEAPGRGVIEENNANNPVQNLNWHEGWKKIENDPGRRVLNGSKAYG